MVVHSEFLVDVGVAGKHPVMQVLTDVNGHAWKLMLTFWRLQMREKLDIRLYGSGVDTNYYQITQGERRWTAKWAQDYLGNWDWRIHNERLVRLSNQGKIAMRIVSAISVHNRRYAS